MPGSNETPLSADTDQDDEFAAVPSPRRRPSLAAVGVMLLSGYLVYHQGTDVLYALSGNSPRNLGPAPALLGPGAPTLPTNRYVRLDGTPDFESAVVLDTQGEWKFRSFFRLLNTGGKLFVQRAPGPLPSAVAERNSFAGRLMPLAQISFSDAIRDYYAKHVAATHVFEVPAFREALTGRQLPGALPDRLGAEVSLLGNDVVVFDIRTPERFAVELPQLHFPDLARAQRALEGTGARVLSGRLVPRDSGASGFAFDVEVSSAQERQVLSAVADLAGRVRIAPLVRSVSARLSDISNDGEALSFRALEASAKSVGTAPSGLQLVPWPQLVGVRTTAQLEIPQDAYLLLEGERPSAHYRSVVATAFLLAFALINLLALRRGA